MLFGGDTLEEAKQCFMDAVDEYIERGILNQEDRRCIARKDEDALKAALPKVLDGFCS